MKNSQKALLTLVGLLVLVLACTREQVSKPEATDKIARLAADYNREMPAEEIKKLSDAIDALSYEETKQFINALHQEDVKWFNEFEKNPTMPAGGPDADGEAKSVALSQDRLHSLRQEIDRRRDRMLAVHQEVFEQSGKTFFRANSEQTMQLMAKRMSIAYLPSPAQARKSATCGPEYPYCPSTDCKFLPNNSSTYPYTMDAVNGLLIRVNQGDTGGVLPSRVGKVTDACEGDCDYSVSCYINKTIVYNATPAGGKALNAMGGTGAYLGYGRPTQECPVTVGPPIAALLGANRLHTAFGTSDFALIHRYLFYGLKFK